MRASQRLHFRFLRGNGKHEFFLILFLFLLSTGYATHYYVSPNGDDTTGDGSELNPWRSIQYAINQSVAGDTVFVIDDGNETTDDYIENVDVNKAVFILGVSQNATTPQVKAASTGDHVFDITASNVFLDNLKIYGATDAGMAAIHLYNVSNCTVKNNTCGWDAIHNNTYGILLNSSSDQNVLSFNTCNYNSFGISLVQSSYNKVIQNTCSNNSNHGLELYNGCNNNVVHENICTNNVNYYGMYLWQNSSYNSITSNQCDGNGKHGILISGSRYNCVSDNQIRSNFENGIELYSVATYNQLINNTIENNSGYGIKIDSNSGGGRVALNDIANNTLGNINNGSLTVLWNTVVKLGYCYNASTSLKHFAGNSYSDYAGNDTDNDGIGDAAYTTGGANDTSPLFQTYSHYNWQTWVLGKGFELFKADFGTQGNRDMLNSGSDFIFTFNEPTTTNIHFSAGDETQGTTWSGKLTFATAPASGHSFRIDVGYADDKNGTNFTAAGPYATITGDDASTEFAFNCNAVEFTIPTGKYLAVKVSNNSPFNYEIREGSAWSYISAPISSDDYSLPILLEFFHARVANNHIILTWRTISEMDNAGFHIDRREASQSEWERINTQLIPGAGNSNTTHNYRFEDYLAKAGTYFYRLISVSLNGETRIEGQLQIQFHPSDEEPPASLTPKRTRLYANYPNPFNPGTTIAFDLNEELPVKLEIFNILGERIIVLENKTLSPGTYHYYWNGKNVHGKTVKSGIYFYRLIAGPYLQVRKMLFAK